LTAPPALHRNNGGFSEHYSHLTGAPCAQVSFAFEIVLKLISDPLRPWKFFIGENWRWNYFDLAIVILCMPSLDIGNFASGLRLLRLMRILKLLSKFPQLRMILAGLAAGIKATSFIVVLMVLVFYMFGIGGLIFFASSDPKHFGTFGDSVVTLFRVSTNEDWTDVMYANYYGCDVYNNGGGHFYLTEAEVNSTRTSAGGSGYLDTLNRTEASDLGAHKFYAPCGLNQKMPVTAYLFFHIFQVVMALVVLSMFVGSVTIAMTNIMEEMAEESRQVAIKRLEDKRASGVVSARERELMDKMDVKNIDGKPLADRIRFNTIRLMLQWGVRNKQAKDTFLKDEIGKCSGLFKIYFIIGYSARMIANSKLFVNFIAGVIVVAGAIVGLQTDNIMGENQHLDNIIVTIFFFEFCIKLLGEVMEPWVYFDDAWNRFDFFIVVCGFLPIGSYVVILRLLRLLRVLKLLRAFPQLQVLVSALMNAFGSIGWIGLILILFYYMFAIVGIMAFGGNDPWHFGNLHLAMMTLFRVSTLENWSDVMYISQFGCNNVDSFPYNRYPELCVAPQVLGYWAVSYFVLFCMLGQFILLSLFIGIIAAEIENVQRAQAECKDVVEKVDQYAKTHHFNRDTVKAYTTAFNMLDELRPSGGMSEDDLKVGLQVLGEGFTTSDEEYSAFFDQCSQLSGESYELDFYGFVAFMNEAPWIDRVERKPLRKSCLEHALTHHARAMAAQDAAMDKHQAKRILNGEKLDNLNPYSRMCYHCAVLANNDRFNNIMLAVVVFAGFLVGLQTGYQMEDSEVIAALDIIVLLVFIFELLVKIFAFEFMPWRFFFEKDKVIWNWFDFAVVVLSVPGVAKVGPALRLLRLSRMIKIINKIPKLKVICDGIAAGMNSVLYILVLMMIVFYIYAVLGVSLWAKNDPWHWRSLSYAFETLYTLASGEGWTSVWYLSYFGCEFFTMDTYVTPATLSENLVDGKMDPSKWMCDAPSASPFMSSMFFVSFIWIASFIMLSLFVGSILISTMDSVLQIADEVQATKVKERMKVKAKALKDKESLFQRKRRQAVCHALLSAWEHSPSSELSKFAKAHRKHMRNEAKACSKTNGINANGVEVIDPEHSLNHKQAQKFGCIKRLYFDLACICQGVVNATWFTLLINVAIIIACVMVGFQACEIGIPNGELGDLVLNIMFTFELVAKMVAEFDNPRNFFKSGWNCLDFIIVVSAYMPGGSKVLLLRMVRLLRVLKVMRVVPELRMLVTALMNSADSVGYVGLLLLVVFYVFAIFTMMFFRENDPWHFKDLHTTLMTLYRTSTSEDWIDIMMIAQRGCEVYPSTGECTSPVAYGFWAVLFWVGFHMVGGLVFLNLFIGVITIGMTDAMEELEAEKLMAARVSRMQHSRTMSPRAVRDYCHAFDMLDITNSQQLFADDLRWSLDAVYLSPSQDQLDQLMTDSNDQSEGDDTDTDNVALDQFILMMEMSVSAMAVPVSRCARAFRNVVRRCRRCRRCRTVVRCCSLNRQVSIH
jgi:voltage-gated sodium channel